MIASRIFEFANHAPAAVLSGESRFFYRKDSLNYLQEYPDGTAVRLNQRDVISVLKVENSIERDRDIDAFFYNIRHNHSIDYDGSMPGYKLGLHELNGHRYYCSSGPRLISPVVRECEAVELGSSWPVTHELLQRLFITPESGHEQFWTLLAHLKLSLASLRQCLCEPRNVRPAQACIIVGPVNCGKTFLFEQVIAPVLGGRVVDAFKAFSANAEGFNGELLNGELWKIDDRHGSTRAELRRTFASNIKSYLFSGNVSFHSKGRTPVTLNPFGRLFIMANDEDKDLLVLPDTTPDMADKLHILRCNPAESPMPTSTEAERVEYCAAVAAELPHLIADLDDWEIPPHLTHTRTGVKSYLNPVSCERLEQNKPELLLAELIQGAIAASILYADEGRQWQGTALELHGRLTHQDCPNWRSAIDLLSSPRSTGIYLGRIAEHADHFAEKFQLLVRKGSQKRGFATYLISTATEPPTQPTLI